MASKRWYRIVPLVGLVLILAAGVAVVSAHGGSVNPGVIHTCVNTASGEFKVVDASAVCKNGQSPLDWNAVGPQGPQGDQGPIGPAGADGAPGISAYEVVVAKLPAAGNNGTNPKTHQALTQTTRGRSKLRTMRQMEIGTCKSMQSALLWVS
ncbi:MAG: hypothetical protein AAB303_00785 [Chloroflexota bacterium]